MPRDSLHTIVAGRRSQPHQLIEVLQDVQEKEGYLSKKSLSYVANELGIPFIDVYRVATFYKAFCLKPRGKNVFTVCTGTACHVRGSSLILEQALATLGVERGETTGDGLFTVECVNCLGACALGPLVVINGEPHQKMNPTRIRSRIKSIRGRKKGRKDA